MQYTGTVAPLFDKRVRKEWRSHAARHRGDRCGDAGFDWLRRLHWEAHAYCYRGLHRSGSSVADRGGYGSWATLGEGYNSVLRRSRNQVFGKFGSVGTIVWGITLAPVVVPTLAGALAFVRCLSILVTFLRSPRISLLSFLDNWLLVNFATDLHHPPELIPGVETRADLPKELAGLTFRRYVSRMLDRLIRRSRELAKGGFTSPIGVLPGMLRDMYEHALFQPSAFLVLYPPSWLYRFCVKATALIYLPLLWVVHDSLYVDASNVPEKIEDLKVGEFERVKRWYSGFVLLFLTIVPLLVWATLRNRWLQLAHAVSTLHPAVTALLSAYLFTLTAPMEIEGWHVARCFNALLTLILFFWVDAKYRDLQRGKAVAGKGTATALNIVLLIRGMVTLYVIGCTLYIVIRAVDWQAVLAAHVRWWPW